MMSVAAVGGWMAAGATGCLAAGLWRALGATSERVARACHELRGPLTAVRLGLQLGAGTAELSPTRLRALDLELGRAALALDDLGAARSARGPARAPLPVDVELLIADSVEAWRPAAAACGVALSASWTGPSRAVWGDRLRLAQAIGNLTSNAIEHGGGAVEVCGRSEGEAVRIEVTDGGPGLPAPVAQLMRRPCGSRGRGLAIAGAVAASHGGRLASAPSERGARLILELPAVERSEEGAGRDRPVAGPSKPSGRPPEPDPPRAG
jgi:signal transduction histidine kinase